MSVVKAVLIGKGISEMSGGFPDDLEIGKEYLLKYDFERKCYIVENKYNANSFKWNIDLP